MPFIVDDQVQFETIEPSNGALSLFCKTGKHFVPMYSSVMANFDVGRIYKIDTLCLAQTAHLNK